MNPELRVHVLFIVLILSPMVTLPTLLSSFQVFLYCVQPICKRARPVSMLNKFFVFAYCSDAPKASSSKSSGIEIEIQPSQDDIQ